MAYRGKERRRYQRYNMETRIHFYVDYELVTKIKFRVIGECKGASGAKKFTGITRNISAEGIRLSSPRKLKRGDKLCLEVYIPRARKPISMVGEVRWSRKMFPSAKRGAGFDTGVRLLTVKGRSVAKSIRIDRKYKEPWSIVLSSVLGGFHKTLHKAMARAKSRSPATILRKII